MSEQNGKRLTPTESKIMEMLSQGRPCTKDELKVCLWDEESLLRTVAMHICNIRRKLANNEKILWENDTYCLVRVIANR